jgi:hypothetical protein
VPVHGIVVAGDTVGCIRPLRGDGRWCSCFDLRRDETFCGFSHSL